MWSKFQDLLINENIHGENIGIENVDVENLKIFLKSNIGDGNSNKENIYQENFRGNIDDGSTNK